MTTKWTLVGIIIPILSLGLHALSYSPPSINTQRRRISHRRRPPSPSRRDAMISCLSIFLPVAAIGTSTPAAAIADDQSLRASSKSNSSTGSSSSSDSDILQIKEATKALSSLIDNWTKATTECIYADVPRELLESKNKEQLLEKASEFALFDKSTSVVSCKRTNRIVRDYIGATGKGFHLS